MADTERHGTARHGTARHDTTRHDTTRRGSAPFDEKAFTNGQYGIGPVKFGDNISGNYTKS